MAAESPAQVYAQAIYETATERWLSELRSLNDTLARTDALMTLDNPAESFDRKKEVLNSVLRPEADTEFRNFVHLLTSKNEMHLLPEVTSEFERIVSHGPVRQLARVSSAVELSPDERRTLEEKLTRQYGPELAFDYRVDKSLLGGIVIRVGDRIIDGSVAGKLAAMRARLEATT